MPPDTRDAVVDFVNRWSEKTEIAAGRFIAWLGIAKSKFYDWHSRYGKVNEHNGKIPRDFWLTEAEKEAIMVRSGAPRTVQPRSSTSLFFLVGESRNMGRAYSSEAPSTPTGPEAAMDLWPLPTMMSAPSSRALTGMRPTA